MAAAETSRCHAVQCRWGGEWWARRWRIAAAQRICCVQAAQLPDRSRTLKRHPARCMRAQGHVKLSTGWRLKGEACGAHSSQGHQARWREMTVYTGWPRLVFQTGWWPSLAPGCLLYRSSSTGCVEAAQMHNRLLRTAGVSVLGTYKCPHGLVAEELVQKVLCGSTLCRGCVERGRVLSQSGHQPSLQPQGKMTCVVDLPFSGGLSGEVCRLHRQGKLKPLLSFAEAAHQGCTSLPMIWFLTRSHILSRQAILHAGSRI